MEQVLEIRNEGSFEYVDYVAAAFCLGDHTPLSACI